jgi:uncharacterized membrane protein YfcA
MPAFTLHSAFCTSFRYPPPMLLWWLVVSAAVFFIGVTKSGFGAGVGLMIVPTAVIAMDHLPMTSRATLGLMLPLLVIGDLLAVWQYRKLFSLPAVVRLLPGTIIGVLAGGTLLFLIHAQRQQLVASLIKLEIGFESVVLVGLHWWRMWRSDGQHVSRPTPLRSGAVGAFAGASSTLAHAAGPIIALHLLPQRMDRQAFVGTCAVYFFLVNSVKLPIYAYSGQFHADMLLLSLKALPLVLAGAAFGFWITRKMNDQLFSKIVYALTFALGWYLLYIGVEGLRV